MELHEGIPLIERLQVHPNESISMMSTELIESWEKGYGGNEYIVTDEKPVSDVKEIFFSETDVQPLYYKF